MKKLLILSIATVLATNVFAFSLGDLGKLVEAPQSDDSETQKNNSFSGFGSFLSPSNSETTKISKGVITQKADTSIPHEEFAQAKIDELCKNPIADWDISQNIVDLGLTAATFYAESIFGGGTDTADRQQATLRQFKHRNWMPLTLEEQLGDYYHSEYMADKVIVNSPELKEATKEGQNSNEELYGDVVECADCKLLQSGEKIWKNVEKYINSHPEFNNHPYNFKFYVTKNNSKIKNNALAMPGGYIYLGSGLIDHPTIGQEAVEMLLIHEVTHSLKRHHTKKTQAIVIDALSSIDKLKNLATSGGNGLEGIAEMASILERFDSFSGGFPKEQEWEADACAIKSMKKEYGHVNSFKKYITENTQESDEYGTISARVKNIDTVWQKIQ